MATPTDEHEPEPRSWNIWLTLMWISVAFTLAVAVLEYLGVFRDLGIILSIVGIVFAVAFGIGGSSQRTVDLIRFDVRGLRRDLARLGGDIAGLRDVTGRGFAEMHRGVAETNRGVAQMSRGVAETNRGVAEMSRGVAEM